MWQALYDELSEKNFTVIAVALDADPEAARPWIEKAQPTYPVPVDTAHRLAELYNLVNVPQAVWIDEEGRIVRPPETAGVYEAFRSMDLATRRVPEAEAAKSQAARKLYLEALRDWVENGASSRFAMAADEAQGKLSRPTAETALAHAHFRLGQHLLGLGREAEAQRHFAEASRLHPDSWAIWRQAAEKNEMGLAAGPEFWARVQALGERRYYPPAEMDGMP